MAKKIVVHVHTADVDLSGDIQRATEAIIRTIKDGQGAAKKKDFDLAARYFTSAETSLGIWAKNAKRGE